MKKILSVILLMSFLVLPVITFAATQAQIDAAGDAVAAAQQALASANASGHQANIDAAEANLAGAQATLSALSGGSSGSSGVTSTSSSAGDAPSVDVIKALHSIVNWAFAIVIIVAGMMLIFSAFTYLTASGDPDKVKKAHDAVLWALVGVAVAVLAKGLVTLVEKIVDVS